MNSIFTSRQQAIRSSLLHHNLDQMLVFGFENIRYLCGYSGNASYLIVSASQLCLTTDYRYFERAKAEAVNCEVICRDRDSESLGECIKRILPKGRTGFDSAYINVSIWSEISTQLHGFDLIPVMGLVETERAVKDKWEVESIKKAAAIADIALADTLKLVKAGITEKELATELDYKMKTLGSDGVSFDTILLFGERSALPHGKPSNVPLNLGDLILIDFGAVVNGYRSDMTRTYVFGEPSKKQQQIYDAVFNAQHACLESVKAGLSSRELNQVSEIILNDAGFGEWAGKGLGHGLGLFLHETPFINAKNDYALRAGNVITIEPGVYLPQFGGVRIEDDVLVTENGHECLTHAPKSFVLAS